MKLLHVIPAIANRYGGPSRAVLGLCGALRGLVDVQVATTDADGRRALDLPLGTILEIDGVRTVLFARKGPESLKFSSGLAGWLREHSHEFDLMHIHGPFSHACVSAVRSARRARRPWIIRPLGTLDPWSLRRHPFRKQLFLALGLRRALRDAAAIHYTTEFEQRRTEAALGLSRGCVVPIGVDDAAFRRPAPAAVGSETPRTIVFLGRLAPKKGIDVLIEAFRTVVTEGDRDWRLVIAGRGETAFENSLRRRARNLPVEWAGWVDGEDKWRLLESAAVLALPSKNENFAIAVAEALAVGCPVLVSREVGLADEVARARAGWVVDADDQWATALLDLRRQADELDRRRENARGLGRQFAWEAIAKRMVQVYESIVRDRALVGC